MLMEPIHTEWHPSSRDERFPGIEKRVQLYMGYWYNVSERSNEAFQYKFDDSGNIVLHTYLGEQFNTAKYQMVQL